MGEKNIQLYSPAGILYSDSAPLLVADGALLCDKRSGKKFVRLRLKNISHKTLNAVTVTVRPLDSNGKALWGDVVCPMDGLNIPRDGEFGQDKSFELLDGDVRSFDVLVGGAVFEDNSIQSGSDKILTALDNIETLEEALGNDELAAQFRIRYGTDCTYQPAAERGLWFCTCGGINSEDEPKCHLCRRTYAAQKAVNLSSLKAECAERLKVEDLQHEEEHSEAAERKRRNLRTAVIIAPIALLLALIIAVLPGYIAGRKAYKTASAMLNAGMYDEAAAAFTELGIYGDSREQAEKNVPYQKALYILDCADEGSTPGLALLDLRRSDFADDEHMRMALYDGAIAIFEGLDGYKDSASKIIYAKSALVDISEMLNSAAYEASAEKLKSGAYLAARDGFIALGSYKDSADMASECMYQKGLALLDFVEKYSVRGISASLSSEAGTPDTFQMTKAALGRLGESGAAELRALCAGDGIDLVIEDGGDNAGLQPMCSCVNSFLIGLNGYKDSAALAERAAAAGDFTKPFYDYCATGDLYAAVSWLNAYDGDFPDRDGWLNNLGIYLPFCQNWGLHSGDSTLIPLTVGADGTCGSFETSVIMSADRIPTLRISFGSEGQYIDLSAEAGSVKFTGSTDEYSFYYAGLNNSGRFTYLKYNADGKVISSVEYAAE